MAIDSSLLQRFEINPIAVKMDPTAFFLAWFVLFEVITAHLIGFIRWLPLFVNVKFFHLFQKRLANKKYTVNICPIRASKKCKHIVSHIERVLKYKTHRKKIPVFASVDMSTILCTIFSSSVFSFQCSIGFSSIAGCFVAVSVDNIIITGARTVNCIDTGRFVVFDHFNLTVVIIVGMFHVVSVPISWNRAVIFLSVGRCALHNTRTEAPKTNKIEIQSMPAM